LEKQYFPMAGSQLKNWLSDNMVTNGNVELLLAVNSTIEFHSFVM